jgi:hypothetical protein
VKAKFFKLQTSHCLFSKPGAHQRRVCLCSVCLCVCVWGGGVSECLRARHLLSPLTPLSVSYPPAELPNGLYILAEAAKSSALIQLGFDLISRVIE